MITVALSVRIGARAETVWRALTDPAEREIWDERVLGEAVLSAAARSRSERSATPKPSGGPTAASARVRWRFRLAGIPQVLDEQLLEVQPEKRAVSHLAIGSMHFDQTLTFHSEDDESGPHTRLGMKLVARNQVPVIGALIERADVQKVVLEYIDATLRQAQKYCER